MKHIVEAFSVLVSLMLNLFVCIAVLNVSAEVAAAKDYKAAVIAEIENSNFNPSVISDCVNRAAEHGYVLEIQTCAYDAESNTSTAEVLLTYEYEIPLFGMHGSRTTRGVAR